MIQLAVPRCRNVLCFAAGEPHPAWQYEAVLNVKIDRNLAPLKQYRPEWASLCTHRHNVLIEGPIVETHTMLRSLQPHMGKPILWKRPYARLELSGRQVGGLILEDVSTLSREEQVRLLAHFDAGIRTQVVSTSQRPLYRLVAHGLFDATLYYRLNVVLLRI